MIPDVNMASIPILPQLTSKNMPVDLSLSALRAASPIHLQYLRNMGSGATMTVSILRRDKLWGLIACHHETPRRISAATGAAVELFAQVFSSQIEAKQQQDELSYLAKARATHDRFVAGMGPEETIFENLRRFGGLLRELIPCDGIGVLTEGRFEGEGITPPDDAIDDLIRMLNTKPVNRVFSTDRLTRHLTDAARYIERVSGVLAIPFSRAPRDFLLLFRREVIQTVTWGGDPNKAVVRGRRPTPAASQLRRLERDGRRDVGSVAAERDGDRRGSACLAARRHAAPRRPRRPRAADRTGKPSSCWSRS